MYRVIEAAELLGVSKVTIYKRISSLSKKIKPYIYKNKGVTYISETGLEMIKIAMSVNQDEEEIKDNDKIENNTNLENKENQNIINELSDKLKDLQDGYIDSLKDQIDYLKNELEIKNEQLKSKDIQLNSKDDLIKNFQILLKEDKNKINLLEQKIQENESENRQETITEQIVKQVRQENQKLMEYIAVTREKEKKKSFFSRLF